MSMLSIKFNSDQDRFLREFLQISFVEQKFTDCTLYCWAEDRIVSSASQLTNTKIYNTFKCHRLILSAYSDFFRQCFLETEKSEISSLFLDIEPRSLENILRLIYFGHIEITQSDIELFFNAATKLSLKDFKIVNPNEAFNVDTDLNHLKRRLTQEESSLPKISKQTKDHKNADSSSAKDKNRDNNEGLSEDQIKQEASAREEMVLGRVADLNDKSHNDIPVVGLISSNVAKLPFPPVPAEVSATAEGTNAYTCTICNKQYSYKISLNKHIKSAHSN